VVSQIFTNPQAESHDDMISFWNAVKHKVQKIIWDQDKFHQRFLSHLKADMENDKNITAQCEFQLCDRTDSSTIYSPCRYWR
jgi:hypothetical protein